MSEEIGHLFMDWHSGFLWVIFFVPEKMGYLFMDWQSFVYFGQSFVCEAKVMDWFLRVGEN